MVDVLIESADRIEGQTRAMYADAGYDDVFVVSITSFPGNPVRLDALGIPDDHIGRFSFIDGGDWSDISPEEAAGVAALVRRAEKAGRTGRVAIVMQCDGGISRSAACAAAAMSYLGQDWTAPFRSSFYRPNAGVFEAVAGELGALPEGWEDADPDGRQTRERLDIGHHEDDEPWCQPWRGEPCRHAWHTIVS